MADGFLVDFLPDSASAPPNRLCAEIATMRSPIAHPWIRNLTARFGGLLAGVASAAALASMPLADEASGVPMLVRFNSEHYNVIPQHSSVLCDAKGRVFIGNVEGVLLYSAGRFEHLHPPEQEMSVQTLALTADQRLLAAGYDEFGVYEEQVDGSWRYVDLDETFRGVPGAHPFGQTWLSTELADGLYFLTERRLFRIGKDGQAQSWETPALTLGGIRVGGSIWTRIEGRGLMRFDGTGFVLVPGGEAFIDEGVQSATVHPQGTLFGSRKRGLYLGDAERGLRHMATPYDEWMQRAQVYALESLANGDFAVATLSGEVAIVDPNLALKRQYRVSNYPITDVAEGRDGGLWFATEGDLARLTWPSSWSFIGEEAGLFGALFDAEWFEGNRWVATSLGLFRSRLDDQGRTRFEALPGYSDEVWDLLRVGDELLVGERDGLTRIHAGKDERILENDSGIRDLIHSKFVPERVLAMENSAILVLDHASPWRVVARHELNDVAISTVIELDADHWLVGDWRGYPLLLTQSHVDGQWRAHLESLADRGMSGDPEQGSNVWKAQERVYATLGDQLFEWRDGRFVARPDHPLVKLAGKRLRELEIRGGPGHEYAFTSRDIWLEHQGEWVPLHVDSQRSRGVNELSLSYDGRLSVVSWGGLLTFDPAISAAAKPVFNLRLHRASRLGDDGKRQWLDRRAEQMLNLPPTASLHVEFGVDGHDPSIEYRTRLDLNDIEGAWSEWTQANAREIEQPDPGSYHLHVEARSRLVDARTDLVFPFKIEPRWYQTRYAAWLGACIILLLGSLVASAWSRYRSRKLHARNAELEREVAAQTRDLEIANQRLAKLAVQDGLTGITNRRGFEQFFARTWNRLAETRQPLAVLMIDVDHFKDFNDRHGHLQGDEVLRNIATQIAAEVHEPEELLARYGGEEFVVVLPNTDSEAAHRRALAICRHCEQFGKERGITVSIGVDACVPRGGLRAMQLVEEADAALYRAKKLGRNRVERGRLL